MMAVQASSGTPTSSGLPTVVSQSNAASSHAPAPSPATSNAGRPPSGASSTHWPSLTATR
jgi:hypothetical protein